jgi:hypothetical protein
MKIQEPPTGEKINRWWGESIGKMTLIQTRVLLVNINDERCKVLQNQKHKQNEISVCLRCGGDKCVCDRQKTRNNQINNKATNK